MKKFFAILGAITFVSFLGTVSLTACKKKEEAPPATEAPGEVAPGPTEAPPEAPPEAPMEPAPAPEPMPAPETTPAPEGS